MSLLAGLAGFGAGVTASLAETKKEEMADVRALNLAKLKAEMQAKFNASNIVAKQQNELALIEARSAEEERREIAREDRVRQEEQRKLTERVGVIKRARAGDTSAQNEADVLGLKWKVEPNEAKIVNLINPNDPNSTPVGINTSTPKGVESLNQLLGAGYIEAGKASLDASPLSGDLVRVHGGGIEPFVTLSDDPRIADLGTRNPNIRVDLMAPAATTDDFGRTIVNRGGVPYVVMPDRTEIPVSQLEGRTETAAQLTPTQMTAPTQTQTYSAANPVQLPPGDYVRLATGPLQAMQRFGLNLPVLGDVLGMFAANSREAIGAAQTRATKSFEMAQRNMAIAYRYNASRTSNLDIKSAEKLFPKFGLLSTDIGTYNQAIEVRNSIAKDIEANRQIARVDLPADQLATEESRKAARDFLSNIQLVLPAIDSYINGYELTEIKIPIGDKKRQLIDLPYETLIDQEQVPASVFANLSDREKELVKLWFNYNGWQF